MLGELFVHFFRLDFSPELSECQLHSSGFRQLLLTCFNVVVMKHFCGGMTFWNWLILQKNQYHTKSQIHVQQHILTSLKVQKNVEKLRKFLSVSLKKFYHPLN